MKWSHVVQDQQRVTNSSPTLVDNIYITAALFKEFSGILLSDISDHFPVFVGVGNSHQNASKESEFL